ncbi:hypothetical protein AB6G92_10375 [Providencia vermicola]|uniref:hypothetical protein n=1 Tax=Providencia vermicola TaxID=333965 RepID=UPI0034DD9705
MNIPFGYFIMGTYLQQGYGVEQDTEAAFQYMLKAAVMGNPDDNMSLENDLWMPLSHNLID